MQQAVQFLIDPGQVAAVANPIRARILEAMQVPTTSAAIARSFGRSRQSIGYHVKALEGLGLLRRTGERRNGNFVEQLFQATARRFVVGSDFAADPERLAGVFRDQVSLAALAQVGETLQRDAVSLIDAAAFRGVEIPSVSVQAEVSLPDETARTAFMTDVTTAIKAVLQKHGVASADRSDDADRFRVVFATYPDDVSGQGE